MKQLLLVSLIFHHFTFSYQHLVLISAPGSGKGTLSQHLIEHHDFVQICAGDLIRAEAASGSEIGKQIEPIINRGDYLPDELVCNMLEKHLLNALKNQKRFILDGFPRSTYTLNFLDKFLIQHHLTNQVCFVQLLAHDSDCLERISSRQVCPNCFKVYNLKTAPTRVKNSCNQCQHNLTIRIADTQAIVQKRLDYFHNQIEPLLDLIAQKYPVIRINTFNKSILELTQEYEQITKN